MNSTIKYFDCDSTLVDDFGWSVRRVLISNPKRHPGLDHFGKIHAFTYGTIEDKAGYPMQSLKNYEVINIILSGEIIHKVMGQEEQRLCTNDVQVLSTGSGVDHQEINQSSDNVELIYLIVESNGENQVPRAAKKNFPAKDRIGRFRPVVAAGANGDGSLNIEQKIFIHWGVFPDVTSLNHSLHDSCDGLFIYLIKGGCSCRGQLLKKGEALSIEKARSVDIETTVGAEILLIETALN